MLDYEKKTSEKSVPKPISKSFILNQIHHFDLLVEREYWRKTMEDIKRHWDSGGVRVHVLDHGMNLLFSCVTSL